jgi:hypothetical protein
MFRLVKKQPEARGQFIMSKQRKSIPKEVQAAQQRADGMVSVDEALDFGSGVSVMSLNTTIDRVIDQISEYNQMQSQIAQKANEIDASIKVLVDLTSRALKGAELRFGRDSSEYEMIGGTRTSDRKRPTRKSGGGTGAVK